MKISIKRHTIEPEVHEEVIEYSVELEDVTLLQALTEIKTKHDATLSFESDCRSSVCGSCAMRVNGKEVLACAHKVQEGDVIEPLKNMPIIRDLVVDNSQAMAFNKSSHAWASDVTNPQQPTHDNALFNALQSDCILCGSCYSACPVYSVNPEFKGPFALTRVWRYVSDVREEDAQDKIEVIQNNGIWDCTLCNECVPVCPQGIAPKQDITMLRNKSGMMGFMDPAFSNNFGGGGFDNNFGSFDGSPDFGAPQF
jgi:fumarate reductase iron-sulfur subunit